MNSAGRTEPVLPEEIVRAYDPLNFLAAQFVRSDARADLLTLRAFDLEIRRIPHAVREPMAGEIRIQWWREVCYGERAEEASASPLASAVQALLARHQVHANTIDPYLDGRIFDLYSDRIEDKQAFEAYAGQTSGTILQLGCLVLDREQSTRAAELSGYLSCVDAILSRVIRPALRGQEGAGRYLPPEALQGIGGGAANPFLMDDDTDPATVQSAAKALAAAYLDKALEVAPGVPTALHPVFLPFVFARDEIAGRIEMATLPSYRLIWRLWRRSGKWPSF